MCVFNLAVALQDPQTDGEIKRGPFLWNVRGREVYGYTPARPSEARRLECVSKPILAFLDRSLPESNDVKSRTGTERDFNIYDNRGNAPDDGTPNHLSALQYSAFASMRPDDVPGVKRLLRYLGEPGAWA